MGKKNRRKIVVGTKKKESTKNVDLDSIEDNRTGGAVALSGFDYQCLFSAYILLDKVTSTSDTIRFEGIEDIDMYTASDDQIKNHIQVKFSSNREDASYMKSILKNYLEIYLVDKKDENRFFTLVYDFEIANGQFKKLINKKRTENLEKSSERYWVRVIEGIKNDNPHWNWHNFKINDFFGQLKFERVLREELVELLQNLLVARFSINSGNEVLYGHSLFFLCFNKMRERETMDKMELDKYILGISDEIDKGIKNPAYHWLKRIDFEKISVANDFEYFEGKKAEPSDIVSGMPIKRQVIEKEIKESIYQNDITVIKATSGQGKTTLAWQVLYDYRKNYSIYQLTWCKDTKELNNIVQYIKSRIKIGEIPLILLDNLNVELNKWNQLVQLLKQEIGTNYKLLLTTREEDWYHYAGDQSAIRSLKLINVYLDKDQAKDIFLSLKKSNMLHLSIKNWESSWEQIRDRGLLIEYVYLLTHGEMLADRIKSQVAEVASNDESGIKYDVLSKICLADTIGVPVTVDKLISFYHTKGIINLTQILKGMENEYFIKLDESGKYFSGIHPIRSQHILDCISNRSDQITIIELLDIIDNIYISKLYANIPFYIREEKEAFYDNLTTKTVGSSYEYHLNAIKGLFSGSLLNYFNSNRGIFDEVNEAGGLLVFSSEVNPYSKFEKFDEEVNTLSEMKRILPDDTNILHLYELSKEIPEFELKRTDYYYYAHYLSRKLRNDLKVNKDHFSTLNYWLVNINFTFGLVDKSMMSNIWKSKDEWTLNEFADLMLAFYLKNESSFKKFISKNKKGVIDYLIIQTGSLKIEENPEENSISVNYILLPVGKNTANNESVERLKLISKILPIYDYYNAKAIQPKIEMLDIPNIPDESEKNMPKRNLIIMFHREFAQLWQSTILSNYEAPTLYDWITHWIHIRQNIVTLMKKNIQVLDKLLNRGKVSDNLSKEIDEIRNKILLDLKKEYPYPGENRPFESNKQIRENISKIKTDYFSDIRNYITQMVGLMMREEENSRLAMVNFRNAKNNLYGMQKPFNEAIEASGLNFENYNSFQEEEKESIEKLYIYNYYYRTHRGSKVATLSMINRWYENSLIARITNIKNDIESSKMPGITFRYPEELIEEGNLSILPLVVEGSDILDDNYNRNLIMSLLPVIDSDVDFIILMLLDESQVMVNHHGIRVSRNYLDAIKKMIEEDDQLNIDEQIPPIPIEIMKRYLETFKSSSYVLDKQKVNLDKYELLFLNLWKITQLESYLSSGDKQLGDYLIITRENIINEVSILLIELDHLPIDLFQKAKKYSEKVINEGYCFEDKDLNEIYNNI